MKRSKNTIITSFNKIKYLKCCFLFLHQRILISEKMYYSGSFIIYLRIAMTTVVIASSRETIAGKTWLSDMKDLSVKTMMESHPLNEGFLLLSDNHKKSTSVTPMLANSTWKSITATDVRNEMSFSIGHLSRRLLNEPNDVTSEHTPIDYDRKMDNFLGIDDEELRQQLVNIEVTVDGSGDTIEPTLETTAESSTSETITTELTSISTTSTPFITNSPTAPTDTVLSGFSTFLITIDCTNALSILKDILNQFNQTFPYWYNVTYNDTALACPRALSIDVLFTFFTNNNIIILTNLFQTLENLVSQIGIDLQSVNTCGSNQIVPVKNVTSCYLINLCSLCGTNPRRGFCLPEKNISRCECFINENHPSVSYVDEFCKVEKDNGGISTSTSWAPIVIGILAGIAGLFCAITSCVLITFICRRRRRSQRSDQGDMQASRIWYIPRARLDTVKDIPNYLDHSSDTSNSTIDRRFFQEMDGNRPTAVFPSDIVSITSCYDPIVELDAIIDNEDVNSTFDQSIDRFSSPYHSLTKH